MTRDNELSWMELLAWAEKGLMTRTSFDGPRHPFDANDPENDRFGLSANRYLPNAVEVVEEVRLQLLRKIALIDRQTLLIDDPIHESQAAQVEQIITTLRQPIDVLSAWCKAKSSDEQQNFREYYDQIELQADWYFENLFARPFSECLKQWTRGYSKNRAVNWQKYLTRSAVLYEKTFKNGNPPKKMSWSTLQRRFLDAYEKHARPGGLFADHDGVISKPSAGPRTDQHHPKRFKVKSWNCDSPIPFHGSNGETLEIAPRTPEVYGGHALPEYATDFDRYFCRDWKDCGGVLVPTPIANTDEIRPENRTT